MSAPRGTTAPEMPYTVVYSRLDETLLGVGWQIWHWWYGVVERTATRWEALDWITDRIHLDPHEYPL